MEPHRNVTFGGGATESTMTPVALVLMVVAIVLVFILPRKWVIVLISFFTFLVPVGAQFNIGGLHFFAHRIVILCGFVRLLFRPSSADRILCRRLHKSTRYSCYGLYAVRPLLCFFITWVAL